MSSRLLVTGATGFVGRWVLRHWSETHPDVEVWATGIEPDPGNLEASEYRAVNLLDAPGVGDLVEACRPTHVIHLAGITEDASLAEHLSNNVLGTENLYEALLARQESDPPRIVQASSAAAYGHVLPSELPISESQWPRPVTAYGLSKLTQDHVASAMARARKLPVILGRIFNLVGPGQPSSRIPMALVRQLLDAERGETARLRVGRISSRRDFVDVRDVATAFSALLESGVPGETYNIASGRDYSVQEVIELLFSISGLSLPLDVDAERIRGEDVPCVRGDIGKIMAATGWRPEIAMENSLRAIWEQRGP